MDQSDEQLAKELCGLLDQQGYRCAFDADKNDDAPTDDSAPADDNTPVDDDGAAFFAALNEFRSARASGDKDAEAEAEERLRTVVRNELIQGG